jgi:hypothetical protein
VDHFLGIYLRDQLAAGVLWRELAQRAERNNKGTELGEALHDVATGIAEDVDTFRTIMRKLSVREDPLKTTLAVVTERLGRLKLNGRIVGYSPLSRFVELEMLVMGIEGKKVLWTTLRDLAGLATRLPEIYFHQLETRAASQRARLEPFRERVGRDVFGNADATE